MSAYVQSRLGEIEMLREGHVVGGGAQRPKPKDRSLLCDEEIRSGIHEGKAGLLFRVRLPSYRSLPLSCIEKIELTIDGEPVDPSCMRLALNGYSHKLDELPRLSKIFWFILDYADVFVERPDPLGAGEHLVDAVMVTVEPYMTGGRFPVYYTSQRRLSTATDVKEAW
jgi:hypothetical protein